MEWILLGALLALVTFVLGDYFVKPTLSTDFSEPSTKPSRTPWQDELAEARAQEELTANYKRVTEYWYKGKQLTEKKAQEKMADSYLYVKRYWKRKHNEN